MPVDHHSDIERHEHEINDLWNAINSKVDGIYEHMDRKFESLAQMISNRLPPWVTVIISLLTFLLGISVTVNVALSR
ncbi:MAG: hypothetical protein IT366_24640 [Candidatus Hydrogenedentes bacterium]|nr:hypothetical protein [Candidatus Hydrogenedentota bacterium]